MIKLFGEDLHSFYLVNKSKILAYSLHYREKEALKHLEKIKGFHELDGEIVQNENLDSQFEKLILEKIKYDKNYELDLRMYKYSKVYEFLMNVKKGQVTTYSNIARETKLNIFNVIRALANNPFIILIPCHRVVRSDGKLSGYTPLGSEFKQKLLEIEKLSDKEVRFSYNFIYKSFIS